jgi:hypothetical protein
MPPSLDVTELFCHFDDFVSRPETQRGKTSTQALAYSPIRLRTAEQYDALRLLSIVGQNRMS